MMDELELLKKDWQNKDEHLPKLTFDEIYKMIWKKSHSIVKWIFYISIIELVFWAAINIIFTDAESLEMMKALHLYKITIALNIINYAVILFFIYKFYVNYKKISFTDSSRKLMKTILNVKKTVTQYVWFNIGIFVTYLIILMYGILMYGAEGEQILEAAHKAGNETMFWLIFAGITIAIVAFLLVLVWVFYKLLYGLLLKQLRENYRKLKKMEV
ncbi:hypothetical protein [Costertonia aggregata]|uniref:Uncharacterized protein n=1 Tax=Costertonia aggregata TaxID=343403 RepID=A0A7H9ASK6_9FLAO|nr:hypothetical protein [Costertonia aggregata]QLG46429.1 hypothetical protein HYG79_14085 [Costertonia aggregata]